MGHAGKGFVFCGFIAAFTAMQLVPYVESVPVPYPAQYPVETPSWTKAVSLYEEEKLEAAAAQFISLAEGGDGHAQFIAGLMYWRGEGVDRDYCQGTYLFDLSARNGNALAKVYLALAYYLSKGVRGDDDLAARLYVTGRKELREQSEAPYFRFSQNQMRARAGFWFLKDLVAEKDSVEEIKHLQPAEIHRFKDSPFFSLSVFVPAVDACDSEGLDL